ncbi:MAG: glycosyltransferase family 39 protein, partial [Candidatus Velthaea sp.]
MIRTELRKAPSVVVLRTAARAVSWPAIVSVLVAFLGLTVSLAFHLSIGQDEAYSLHTSTGDLVSALRRGVTYEAQAPLYFGILELWRTVSDSVFFARLLSIAFSCVTLGFAWQFARRYIRGIAAETVLAFVAFNPFIIWASVEIRPYSAAAAFATALLYYFFRGWIDDDADLQPRLAFVAVAIVGAYTHYYIVALVAAGAVAVVGLGQRRKLVSYLIASGVIAVALVPILFLLPLQLESYSALSNATQSPAYSIVLAIFEFLLPHHIIRSWIHRPAANTAYFVCAIALGLLLIRLLTSVSKVARALVTIAIGVAAMFAVLIGAGHMPVTFPRQTAVLFAPTLFAALALIRDVRPTRRPLILQTYAAVYALLVVLSFWSDYHDVSKSGDWRRVGRLLSTVVAPNDAIAVFDTELSLPLGYYFNSHPLTPIPRPLTFDRFDEDLFVIHNRNEVVQSLGRLRRDHTRVWLVMNDLCASLPQFYGCPYLDAYIGEHFRIVKTYKFNR